MSARRANGLVQADGSLWSAMRARSTFSIVFRAVVDHAEGSGDENQYRRLTERFARSANFSTGSTFVTVDQYLRSGTFIFPSGKAPVQTLEAYCVC